MRLQSWHSLHVFVHHEGQYYQKLQPKIYVDVNRSLFIDLNYEIMNFIPDRVCRVDMTFGYDNCYVKAVLNSKYKIFAFK